MGGIAMAVNWRQHASALQLDPMLDLISHRAAGGFTRGLTDHAVFGEARDARDPAVGERVTTVGTLSIVADLRLWNRDGLRGRVGGLAVSNGMNDRQLLLEAYRRTGISFLDSVDGDFAFVIWDDEERKVLAVRDRFAVKPLHFERTATGIRFASEPKQLACTDDHQVTPHPQTIGELLLEDFHEARYTYFEGIQRVLPSTSLVATESRFSESRYWNPSPETLPPPKTDDIGGEFRERLIESVGRRIESSSGVVSQLSGGLDSTSVGAAASILHDRDAEMPPFHTVSSIFPGLSSDESHWINEIVARQPFPHHESAPTIPDTAAFDKDMWEVDSPWIQPIRGMWTFPAKIGHSLGADLALTGLGGNEVLDQNLLLPDLLRTGSLGRWLRGGSMYATWSGRHIGGVLSRSTRTALPMRLKSMVRRRRPPLTRPPHSLIGIDLWNARPDSRVAPKRIDYGFPSMTQNRVLADGQNGLAVWTNDSLEAGFSYQGLGLSHPFLDRSVVEFIASIPVLDRPFDGRTKTFLRSGFSGDLPPSVLNRPKATSFTRYLATVFTELAPAYRERYPTVSEAAEPYLDASRYRLAIERLSSWVANSDQRYGLWSAWTLMAWLDGLGRY
jgi:asparagine synthase (glutamine-hydrolysing)